MTKTDEYQLTSGLPLDDVDVTIANMEFGFNAQIGAGVVCANIVFRTDDGVEQEQSFSVGDDWDIINKGDGIAGSSGGVKKLSTNSNYGRLVESMIKAVGDPDQMPAGSPKLVDGWVGTRWHLGTVKIKTRNPQTNETKERNAIIVTEYHGTNGVANGVASGGASGRGTGTSTADAGPVTKLGGKPTLESTDPDLFAKLVALAGGHEDHASFVEAALELDEVDGNQLAATAIMSRKPGGVWAARS